MNSLLKAMKSLGGSGTIEEIFNKVVEISESRPCIACENYTAGKICGYNEASIST